MSFVTSEALGLDFTVLLIRTAALALRADAPLARLRPEAFALGVPEASSCFVSQIENLLLYR